jgi:hypothetical protein
MGTQFRLILRKRLLENTHFQFGMAHQVTQV